MTKEEKIAQFDPNGLAGGDSIYGLPFNLQESETVIFPVPWEVTVSYTSGTAKGPSAIKAASAQVDLYDPFLPDAWKKGIYMMAEDEVLKNTSSELRTKAEEYLEKLGEGKTDDLLLKEINTACRNMVDKVERETEILLNEGKRVALVGGDHSTPLGFIKTLARREPGMGILQIDAHADLRKNYEGFEFSHASIMYNAMKISDVSKLVQLGIRDYCEEEVVEIENSRGRIVCFYDRDIKHSQYKGLSWADQCEAIIEELPEKVYVSFDIDGLDPKLCPNTGTPVAGGFEVEQVLFLLEKLAGSGKRIIGFDLNEVSPADDEWDANVGARLLYKMCNIMAVSQQNKFG